MKHLLRQYALILILTVLGTAGMFAFATTLIYYNPTKGWVFFEMSLLIVTFFTLLDYAVFHHFFKPILAWLNARKQSVPPSETVVRAAVKAIIAFPYKAAGYFLAAWIAGVESACFLALYLGVFQSNTANYVTLALMMHAGAIIPIFFYVSKRMLRPLRLELASQAQPLQNLVLGININLRQKMIASMLFLGIFAGLFGGIVSYNRVQPLIKKYIQTQAEQAFFHTHLFLQELGPKVSPEILKEKLRTFMPGKSYIYLVDKTSGAVINNPDGYSAEVLLGHREIFLADRLILQNANLDSRYVIGAVMPLDESIQDVGRFLMQLILLTVVCLLIAGLLAFLTASEFLDSFGFLAAPIKKIAQGDLTSEIQLLSEDETGMLATLLKQMNQSLYEVTAQITRMVRVILDLAHKLAVQNQGLNTSFETIAASSNEVADTVGRQFEQLESTGDIMSHLREAYALMNQDAAESAQTVEQAVNTAQAGGVAVQAFKDQMLKIDNMVVETRTAMNLLHGKSVDIGNVLILITKIARNTNTLALNASIEAARAGEAGRGFAVVANEVHTLAEGAASAAKRIQPILNEIQQETSRVLNTIEASRAEVERGQNLADQANTSFSQIVATIQDATRLSSSIAKAASEQMAGTDSVNTTLQSTTNQFKQSTVTSREVATLSEDQKHTLVETTNLVQQLNSLASELGNLVKIYKLKS
ncbi:MAG: methyl-accepting chemotaxis protein [Candidatus Firestonebacteria bacterium]|nr:methyl-accepting chemotaxis protein [Candidatus Firestonebacteria bacterium]